MTSDRPPLTSSFFSLIPLKSPLPVRWLILALLLAGYAFLAFRSSPQVSTLSLVPRSVSLFLDQAMIYRNLWAFALLGLYVGTFLGVRLIPPRSLSPWILTIAFLLAAPAKELLQTAFPPRDGNIWGAALGMVGTALGLSLGQFLRRIVAARSTSPRV